MHEDGVINNNNLKLNAVQEIMEDKSGNIWFTTWFEGVCRYDGKSITNYKPNGEVWFSGILEDQKGNIWIGRRSKGVFVYNGKTFTNVLQHGSFDSCCISKMAIDKAGKIWFCTEFDDMNRRGTMGGLWSYDGKSFKNFTTRDGLADMSVFSITIDSTGLLWVGTRGLGLCSFNGKTFTNYSR